MDPVPARVLERARRAFTGRASREVLPLVVPKSLVDESACGDESVSSAS